MRFCHAVKRKKNIPGRQKSISGKSVKVYGQLWGAVMQQGSGGRHKDEGVCRVEDLGGGGR